MRKMREKKKEREELKASYPKSLLVRKKKVPYSVMPGVFYRQYPVQNYQKLQIQTLLQGEIKKKTKKRTKSEKVKRATGIFNRGEK